MAHRALALPAPLAPQAELPGRAVLVDQVARERGHVGTQNEAQREALQREVVAVIHGVGEVVDTRVFERSLERAARVGRAQGQPPLEARLVADHVGLVVVAEREIVHQELTPRPPARPRTPRDVRCVERVVLPERDARGVARDGVVG